jgi:hypothetical protein
VTGRAGGRAIPTDVQQGVTQMRFLKFLLVPAMLGAGALALPAGEGEGWVKLFNGKDIEGFKPRGGTATYRVEDGAIVGKTAEGSPNTFLFTPKEYGDFELKFEVKVDNALNSGVQIRSKAKKAGKGELVYGPQVEIATNGTAGYIYGEALGTGWLTRQEGKDGPKGHKHFKNDQWNQYKVRAVGDRIQTWVNGEQVADYVDTKTKMRKGHIGFQVHSIGKGQGPYEVRWKNIYVRELTGEAKEKE